MLAKRISKKIACSCQLAMLSVLRDLVIWASSTHSYHLDYMSMAMRTFADRALLAIIIWHAAVNWSLAQDMCRQIPLQATQTFRSPYCGTVADRDKFCAQRCSRRIADYIYRLAWTAADVCSIVNPRYDWDLRFQNLRSTVTLPGDMGMAGEGCSQTPNIECMCSVDVMLQRAVLFLAEPQQSGHYDPMQAAIARNKWWCLPNGGIANRMNPAGLSREVWYRDMVQQEAAERNEVVQDNFYPGTDAPGIPSNEHIWRVHSEPTRRLIRCEAHFDSAFADLLMESGSGSCTIKRPDLSNKAKASGTLGLKCSGGLGMVDIVDRLKRLYEADPRNVPTRARNFIRVRDLYAWITESAFLEMRLGQDFASLVGQQMGEYMAGASNLSPEALAYGQQHPTQYYL
ncbi:hypothetical protein BCR37DRAFT_263415 [Protomyces lactucae-debilis]|uniref:Uncharacterized protein n=1 Tax=Protomyces lactucae-debilis TaxID=2754530 RepID=A0A1Y2FJZ8_PROLT|nr:uncharacterized protein BCR37DRAFT_263415 [Protomyces lactucae-debilis]ORY84292.1 hypothetical protein BCR37DRAFT_263415 [Protomyces lactucae-debilis]